MCTEMNKLAEWLTENGIKWLGERDDINGIDRINFSYRNKKWSAINGWYTYGGYDPKLQKNYGMIELKDGKTGEVTGWLSANQVLETIMEQG